MEQSIIKSTTGVINNILALSKIGDSKMLIDYDKEADVLYISFGKPQKADNSEEGDDGIVRRKKNNKLIGLTVMEASRFAK